MFAQISASEYNEALERSELFFLGFPREKKPLHNGSYERRVPKIKNQTLFCTRDVCACDCVIVCVIQHRNWPIRSTILNAHGTNCSADGFYARTHINEPYLCYYVVFRSKLAEADAATCVFTGPVTGLATVLRFSKIQKIDQRFFVSLTGTSTTGKIQ